MIPYNIINTDFYKERKIRKKKRTNNKIILLKKKISIKKQKLKKPFRIQKIPRMNLEIKKILIIIQKNYRQSLTA